ncbi:MAG: sensor histidine kinase [Marmoricola sp.]|nr:sensor histidine kinase [Marmoricola sp.]
MDEPTKFPGRLRMTAYAAAQVLLAIPVLVLFVLTVVASVLVVVWIGIGVLLVSVPASRWIANRHRAMASRVLGVPVPAAYRVVPEGANPVQRLTVWARDPLTWRDLAWALMTITVGFTLSLLAVVLLVVIATGALWWFGIEPIMRARSRLDQMFLSYGHTEKLEQRVQVLTETRAETIDHSAAELRRIERDLHDGAQARLVALGMSLGVADDMFGTDPEGARKMVVEARSTTRAALGELRSVVRGIHPPVLADRGLTGAVSALALDMAVPVVVEPRLAGRPPAPVESAVYFAIAECLANIGKHAAADRAWVDLSYADGRLVAVVGDNGKGGANPSAGTGMRGVMRRLSAFDGTMMVSSPDRGPTIITLEVPCALSSPKTTPSSGTA